MRNKLKEFLSTLFNAEIVAAETEFSAANNKIKCCCERIEELTRRLENLQKEQEDFIEKSRKKLNLIELEFQKWHDNFEGFSENIRNNNLEMEHQRKVFQNFSENIRNNNLEMEKQRDVFLDYESFQRNSEQLLQSQKMTFESYSINLKNNNQLMNQVLEKTTQESKRIDTLEKGLILCTKKINDSSTGRERITVPSAESLIENTYSSIDYLDFENHFRGSRSLIQEQQKQYLPYFLGKKQVLDIGCGRGEFLELLSTQKVFATGVDIYEDFVLYCTSIGLNAICDDCIHYLKKLKSVDGIFAGQVVEHMTTGQIIELCDLAYQKLLPGSYFIIETPNPTSLAIYTNAFYIDPSHIKPVHPLTMKYFLEKSGFSDIEIKYTDNSELAPIPPVNIEGSENIQHFNAAMERVSKLLFGSQDYAIIARKD